MLCTGPSEAPQGWGGW